MDLPAAPIFCTDPDPGTPIDGPFRPYSGAVTVSCSPRRAIVYGRFPDRLPAPRSCSREAGPSVADDLPERRERWVAFLPDAPVRGLRAGDVT